MPKNATKTMKTTTTVSKPVPRKTGAAALPAKNVKTKIAGPIAASTAATAQRASVTTKAVEAVVVEPPQALSRMATERTARAVAARPAAKLTTTQTVAKPTTSPIVAKPMAEQAAAAEVLAKAEADIMTAIDTLNSQMNSAISTLTELAASQRGEAEAVMRTLPMDRATSTFHRLVGEVVDDQLAEMLPTLVALRGEMAQRARHATPAEAVADDFFHRGTEMLDHVLTTAGASRFEPHAGAAFDPLIHLAVGETHRDDLADGAVAEAIQPGYRTARGKVIAPARVKVNRR